MGLAQRWEYEPGCRAAAFDRYRQSWRDKARYADTALRQANELDRAARERILGDLVGVEPAIIVWNDQPCPVTGLAEVTVPRAQQSPRLKSLHDPATGKSARFQRMGANRYLVEAVDVPPLGYRILRPEWAEEPEPWQDPHSQVLPSCPGALDSDRLVLTLDPVTGVIRQVEDKHTGETWLAQSAPRGLGEFCYARVHNVSRTWKSSAMAGGIEHQWIPGKLGRVWRSGNGLARERIFDAPGQPVRVIEEIHLEPGECRLDFRYRIDKPETAAKESGYIWFGFDLPDAVFRCDQAVGWIEPRRDLLPGAMQDAFYAMQWADLSTAARGVTLVGHEAPLIQVGRLRTYEWRRTLPFAEDGSALIAWPYHNLQQTDNPIWQDLLMEIQFSLFLHHNHGFDAVGCDRDAAAALFPLRAQLAHVRPRATARRSGIALESEAVRWLGSRLLPDGQTVCVRLEERAGRAGEAVLCFEEELAGARKADSFFNDEAAGVWLKSRTGVPPVPSATAATRLERDRRPEGFRGTLPPANQPAADSEGHRLRVPMHPYELATVLVRLREAAAWRGATAHRGSEASARWRGAAD